ncbi:MAG: hypothetical protein H7Y07_13970 [Pyrinomonadaceae bacterium]|nr:hypothetical protein [Sphingobacteriaceae bacterium]
MNSLRLLLIVFLSFILWQFLSQFFFCTQFSFKESTPFKGDSVYNPYSLVNSKHWKKCNFHAHANAWKGITNGEGTASDVHHAYDSLHYNVHCVSNYHSIDTNIQSQANYIPAYEHGYNILKTHQLVLGSQKVCWLDYILPQTLSNKQDILNYLSADTNAVVILNHPAMREGYGEKDFLYLNNFHCMEVLNPAGTSFPQWDAALSAGKPIFIVGNDDIHNVIKKERLGRMCTFVNAEEENKDMVLHALKKGSSYGVIIGNTQHADSIPLLKGLTMSNDTIRIEMDSKAAVISFIGQNGRNLASFSNTEKAQYILQKEDHYARAVITYQNGTGIFLNPVFYVQTSNPSQGVVLANIPMTMFLRALGFSIAGTWIFWVYIFLFGKAPIYIPLPFLSKRARKTRLWKKKKPAVLT